MKRFFIFLLFVSATLFSAVCPAAAADPVVNIGGVRIRKVLFAVSPADRQECRRNKESWGLKHCLSGGRDYLAGAAKACGGLQNLPTGKEAKELAVLLYGDDRGKDALYGPRDDRLLEQIGLPSSYDHLYVWLADETADGRVFSCDMLECQATASPGESTSAARTRVKIMVAKQPIILDDPVVEPWK